MILFTHTHTHTGEHTLTPTQTQRTVPLAQLQHVPSFSLLDGCHGDVIDKGGQKINNNNNNNSNNNSSFLH